jgi:HEAT repeat protein
METNTQSNRAAVSGREAEIAAILKQMATVLKNMRTYQHNNPVLQKSFAILLNKVTSFLEESESLTLIIRENELFHGSSVVYRSEDRMDSLAFALYRDGMRLLSLRSGLSERELHDFIGALHEAREADPFEADLVTILWEKDLANITYRAVDAYLDDDEKKSIDEMTEKRDAQPVSEGEGDLVLGSEFFMKELGLSVQDPSIAPRRRRKRIREADVRRISHEILEEDDRSILRRCTDICLEILSLDPRGDTFERVADFLGRICDWSASSGDFLTACTILSDLRTLRDSTDLPDSRKASIDDSIAKLGDKRKIAKLEEYLETLAEQRSEEIFAYLTMLPATAVGPLCQILAECEIRRVRYLLCRAISVIAKNEPERLRHYIQDRRWYFVRNVVMIIGMTGNPEGIPFLRMAMSHPEDRVRREVARSIGKIKDKQGLDVLTKLMDDSNKMVRFASLSSMRELDAREARERLEVAIIDKSFTKKSPDEKREFMRSYGSLGKVGFRFLEAIISGRYKHMDEETVAAAVYGVAMINDEETTELLKQVIEEEEEGRIQRAALEAVSTLTMITP